MLRGWRSRKGRLYPGQAQVKWEALGKAPDEKVEKEGILC